MGSNWAALIGYEGELPTKGFAAKKEVYHLPFVYFALCNHRDDNLITRPQTCTLINSFVKWRMGLYIKPFLSVHVLSIIGWTRTASLDSFTTAASLGWTRPANLCSFTTDAIIRYRWITSKPIRREINSNFLFLTHESDKNK